MFKFKYNSRGSAIIQAMIATALMSIIGLGAASLSSNFSKMQRIEDIRAQGTVAARLFGAVGASSELCVLDLDNKGAFNDLKAKSATVEGGQELQICIPSLTLDGNCTNKGGPKNDWFPGNGGGPARIRAIPGMNLSVRDIYFSNATAKPPVGGITEYTGKLSIIMQSNDAVPMAFAPRESLGSFTIFVNGGNISGCSASSNAADICKALGGIYDLTKLALVPPQPVCQFGLPDMTCAAGQVLVGVNADGSPQCAPGNKTCSPGEVTKSLELDSTGVKLNCAPVGAWDYSDFGACAVGQLTTSRTVRCVSAAAMDQHMRSNGFTSFQAALPANIIIDDNFCLSPTSPKPDTDAPCPQVPCIIAAGSSWLVGTSFCAADADITIPDGGSGVATDATPYDTGTATFSCLTGVPTLGANSCISAPPGPVCGPANAIPTAIPPVAGLCSVGVASAVTDGGTQWDWSCTQGSSVSCSVVKGAVAPSYYYEWIPFTQSCASRGLSDSMIYDDAGWGHYTYEQSNSGADLRLCVMGITATFSVAPCAFPYVDSGLDDDSDARHDLNEQGRDGTVMNYCLQGITAGGFYQYDCPEGWWSYGNIWDDRNNGVHAIYEGHSTGLNPNQSEMFCVQPSVPPPFAGRLGLWIPFTSSCSGNYPNDSTIYDDTDVAHVLSEDGPTATLARLCLQTGITANWRPVGLPCTTGIDTELIDDFDGIHFINEGGQDGSADQHLCIDGVTDVLWVNGRCPVGYDWLGYISDPKVNGYHSIYEGGGKKGLPNEQVLCVKK